MSTTQANPSLRNEPAPERARTSGLFNAVRMEPLVSIMFVEGLPENLDRPVEADVWLDELPDDLWTRAKGRPIQDHAVAVAVDNPRHYRVFGYREEITPDFRDTGYIFGGCYLASQWERVEYAVDALTRIPNNDPPELMEQVLRNLQEA
jgi:hypothetical protein